MDLKLILKLMNALGQMRKHERWTRAQLEAYQAESLGRLREFAALQELPETALDIGVTARQELNRR